ncbi:MAG: alpha/beta hydrolase [Terriglobales bacterium]|jgi:microsomal epoxide hydrolase
MLRNLLRLLPLLMATYAVAGSVNGTYLVTSDGVRLHYLEAGSGPAIVFEPGWMMMAGIWQSQIDYFSRSYHVIALDPRSQGDSDKTTEGDYPEIWTKVGDREP